MKKILSSSQIRELDQFTIKSKSIASHELMERAAMACTEWLIKRYAPPQSFSIFCGNGNNGGDGLAIARILLQNGYKVFVFIAESGKRSDDNLLNLNALRNLYPQCILPLNKESAIAPDSVIVDALLGTGLNREADDKLRELILKINAFPNCKISIDMPSGLSADDFLEDAIAVRSEYTLSFHNYKKTFLFPETGIYTGQVVVLDIGLDSGFEKGLPCNKFVITHEDVHALYKTRLPFSHKGNFGHALMIAGSRGKMGACILACKAALRSGVGLITALIPEGEQPIIQTSVPEAMTLSYHENNLFPAIPEINAIGIGCGLGVSPMSEFLLRIFTRTHSIPFVVDADALNLIEKYPEILIFLPKWSVLTPHPKEFDRLFGPFQNSFERHEKQIEMSVHHGLYIILKGRYTCLSAPDGCCYFNATGNAGLAKGGSGDMLTGIITALFAQYKDMFKASIMGVYLHGLAADICAENMAMESMTASDVIEKLSEAFKKIRE